MWQPVGTILPLLPECTDCKWSCDRWPEEFQCLLSLDQDCLINLCYGALGCFTRFWSDTLNAWGLGLLDQAGSIGGVGAVFQQIPGTAGSWWDQMNGKEYGNSPQDTREDVCWNGKK